MRGPWLLKPINRSLGVYAGVSQVGCPKARHCPVHSRCSSPAPPSKGVDPSQSVTQCSRMRLTWANFSLSKHCTHVLATSCFSTPVVEFSTGIMSCFVNPTCFVHSTFASRLSGSHPGFLMPKVGWMMKTSRFPSQPHSNVVVCFTVSCLDFICVCNAKSQSYFRSASQR
jgi:hypothetical protein